MKALPPRPQPLKATLPEPPLPPPTKATTTIQRRPAPPTALATSILRDDSNEEVDAEMRHLGISVTRTTTKLENNNMIIDHYDGAKRISAKQQHIFDTRQAKARGISDELISDLGRS